MRNTHLKTICNLRQQDDYVPYDNGDTVKNLLHIVSYIDTKMHKRMHSVPILIMHKMAQSTNIRIMMLSRCTMHFPVVVLYELLDECTVLIQDLVSHIRDVVKNCLIFHHEVLLRRSPGIHRWYRIH